MTRSFRQVDVFGSGPYSGNPVAVVHGADGLSDEAMQRFAHWTNLSETTFLLAPTTGEADYRVRIFTPGRELPFAGHPTLGTCHAWLEAGGAPRGEEVVQECAAGLIRLRRSGGRLAFSAPPLLRSGPVDEADLQHVVDVLRLERSTVVDAEWTDNGPGWVSLLLRSAEDVLSIEPGLVDLDIGVVGPYPAGSETAFEVRALMPKDGSTAEDPVTGSLNAGLAGWLIRTGRATAPYVASQGTVLGRSGRIHVDQDADGTIWVGGATTTFVTGEVGL
jgi:PhzF family phenazine biosynthesis protein